MRSDPEDARRLAGLVLFRVLVSSVLGGATLWIRFAADETSARGSLFAYLTVALLTSTIEFAWILSNRGMSALALSHSATEAGLATWLVSLTGGADSPFIFLLLVAIVLGAVAAGSVGAFIAAILSTAALFSMAGLVWLSHSDPGTVVRVLASAGGCFATAALASYLTQRLQHTGRELRVREGQLRNLGELYLKVAQSLRSGLMTLSPGLINSPGSARVTLLNPHGAQILGWTSVDAEGMELSKLSPELASALDAVLAGNGRSECAVHVKGKSLLLGFSLSPLRDEGAEALGSVVTFQDLTEQRKLEESVRRQSHLASLGELSAGLAHEIRNPLAALAGAAQILKTVDHPALSPEDRKMCDIIGRETQHLETLVSDFLTFARPPLPELRRGNLADLARVTAEAFRAAEMIGERRLDCDLSPALAIFDPAQLRQVFWNLLRNALEATGPRGRILLQVCRSADNSQIVVADDGPGVPVELRDRIFEPFFTTKEQGTGIGLALVGRIVGAHGGTIEIHPRERGASFVISLPAVT